MKIPDDIYGTVFDLTTAIVNASFADDTRSEWRLYDELRAYCEQQAEAGWDHPFLWETLGDFTTDDKIATGLYLKALEQAKRIGATDYEASILLALAESYRRLGETALAHRHAAAADEKARGLDDLELRRDISQFLLDESKHT